MTVFWIITFGVALAIGALLVLALMRGKREIHDPANFDLKVYRDQLREIEKDIARGVVAPEDAERVRTEISRRILTADAKARETVEGSGQSRPASLVMAGLLLVVLLGGTFALYQQLGAPGYGDLSLKNRIAMSNELRSNRPSQADAEAGIPTAMAPNVSADYIALVEKLREAVTSRPDDLQGHILLARSEAALGNFVAAYKAHGQIISLKGDAATAEDYTDYAGMMILAAGGYVSPEAQRALEGALQRDPKNGAARYYAGLMMEQTGRPDVAFGMWQRLLADSTSDDPWTAQIRASIEDLAMRAGVNNFTLPPETTLPGPSQDDIANAAEMTDEERQDMIRGMVAGLSDRLATEGGTPQEWARLLSAYGVLGETDQARAIWQEAQQVFASSAEALDIVRQGALRAGVVE